MGFGSTVVKIAAVVGVGAVLRSKRQPDLPVQVPGSAQWPPLVPVTPDIDLNTSPPVSNLGHLPPPPDMSNSAEKSTEQLTGWVAPNDDGSCPSTHPVKAKMRSGIFYERGHSLYDVTRADRCYPNATAALADGLREPKR